MRFLPRLRRSRVCAIAACGDAAAFGHVFCGGCQSAIYDQMVRQYALQEEAERLFPGTDGELFDARQVVLDYCQPIKCDIRDNYVCAAHRAAP